MIYVYKYFRLMKNPNSACDMCKSIGIVNVMFESIKPE